MQSARLTYTPLEAAHLEAFHDLVRDDHIRRYLLDGQLLPRDWSEARVRESRARFERRGVGIWMVGHRLTAEPVGFCGFLEFPAVHPEPQLVYALRERFTGRGYATEMARASIAEARRHAGFVTIHASVDAVNAASLRILEKLGFERISTVPGAFGDMLLLRLDGEPG